MMEFRIINTHIRFSHSADIDSDNTDFVDLGDIVMRRNEFDVLQNMRIQKRNIGSYSDMHRI